MSYPPSPSHYPNLPAGQRFTQWLVDQFNGDERRWRDLQAKIGDIAKRLKRECTRRKAKGRRI
jgi:hypothetical protein